MLKFCIKPPLIKIELGFKNNREFNTTSFPTKRRSCNDVNPFTAILPLIETSLNTFVKFWVPAYKIPLTNKVFGLLKNKREFKVISPSTKIRLLKDVSIDTTKLLLVSVNVVAVLKGFTFEV